MANKKYNKIFIWAFLFLYLLVAAISFCHAIEFFTIGNVPWMAVTLAFAFELGLAVCLASILLGVNKNNMVAWILLTVLVIVQVCGNTYSVFKYISLSGTDYYQYLAKPLLFFIEEVSEETVKIIISWIMGAILPIVALLMTEMVSKTIRNTDDSKIESVNEKQIESVEESVENEGIEEKEDNDSNQEVAEKPRESKVVQKIKRVLNKKKDSTEYPQDVKFTQTGPMIQQPKPNIGHYSKTK